MRRAIAAAAAALALGLAAPARAQVRVEAAATRVAPAGVAAVASGFAAPLGASALTLMPAPSLHSPLNAAPTPVAAPLATPIPAAALAAPYAAPAAGEVLPEASAAVPASPEGHPRDWEYGRWRLPRSAEGAAWRFRDFLIAGSRLWDGSKNVRELGSGIMGTVFVHPSRPDAVVKIARRGYADAMGNYMAPDDETALDHEDFYLARLAAVGAAPRPLARLRISGRPASERERIYGSTLAQLKSARLFGAREHALVQALLDRIAEGGFIAYDLNFGNIMIGRRDGDRQERAWLVDTLGVSLNHTLTTAGRKAHMLAADVPWLVFKGFGVARPLAWMLDGALHGDRPLMPEDKTPLPWSKPRRYATLAALLGALSFLPPLVHAALPAAPSALGILPSWTALAGLSVALALAGIPLRIFAHRLAPWVRKLSADQGVATVRNHPASAVPELAIAALIEEALFRGLGFLGGAVLLMTILPHVAAFAVAALASSFVFALTHKYGSVWMRVVGGMIYGGALILTGSLLLPVAAHFAYNLSLYIWGHYLRP
ncbi:MAG: CPBP family intramembrane glutamic endopeptidase [Elusimicrobiota bacterium]